MNRLNYRHYRRVALLTALLVGGFLVLEARLCYLQIERHGDLGDLAERYSQYRRILDPWRGEIRARGGDVMAISRPVKTVYADLTVCSNQLDQCARILAESLRLNAGELLARLRSAVVGSATQAGRQALLIQRGVTEADWGVLTNAFAGALFFPPTPRLGRREKRLLYRLQHRAVWAEDDQQRVYTPAAGSLGHLLGYTATRRLGHGLEGVTGLEAYFDMLLEGAPGGCVSRQDAEGGELPFLREAYLPSRPGNHLVLTIDPRLQDISEKALAAACARHCPSNATVLILQPKTGEILAWVAWPSQIPELPASSPPESLRNHAITDPLEPGSVFKIITLAAALEEQVITLDQLVDGEQGRYGYQNAVLRDRKPYGRVTVREATAQSINIVFAKLGIALGPQRFSRRLSDFGFGRVTGLPLPGESAGTALAKINWSEYTQTRLPIGQGLGVTQLQMALAACAIGNQGRLMRPLLVSHLVTPQGRVLPFGQPACLRQVIHPKTAQQVLVAMTGVVSDLGTGQAAALATHTVAGKTGTAQIANDRGYIAGAYYASFVGLVPAKEPQLCILVALKCPQNGHTGGLVAAPVFHQIAEQAVACLRIPADKSVPATPARKAPPPKLPRLPQLAGSPQPYVPLSP